MADIDIEELKRKKRYLKRYRKNIEKINRLEEKLATLDERIYGVRSPVISDMPKGGGSRVTQAELLSEKMDLEKRINNLVQKGRVIRAEITEKIDELDDALSAEILEGFFIECKDLDDLAEELGYSERHIKRLYSGAILKISLECHTDVSNMSL